MSSAHCRDQLNPQLLKPAVTQALNDLLAPIQAAYKVSEDWQKITEVAYPPEAKKAKDKKVKNKGTRHPGGQKPNADSTADTSAVASKIEAALPDRTA